jgi:acetamidase/formamidase
MDTQTIDTIRTVERGQVFRKDDLKYALSHHDAFIGEVENGEVFEVETELNIGGHLIQDIDARLKPGDVTLPFVNPATGPIRLNGAHPGDTLVFRIIDVGVHGCGYTALWPGIGIFPDWVRREEFGVRNHTVRVEDGIVHWSDTIRIPAAPMVGVIGVAPVEGGVLTIDNGTHGGNLDVQEVTNGNLVSFPVAQEGAYLYFGDVHALQGDAECNGMGAIEIRGHVRCQVYVIPGRPRQTWPRIETPTHLCTVGCARPLDDALRISFEEMIYWLEASYRFSATEAYMLLGQIAEARCTQMVNPKYTYICKVSKKYLPGGAGIGV